MSMPKRLMIEKLGMLQVSDVITNRSDGAELCGENAARRVRNLCATGSAELVQESGSNSLLGVGMGGAHPEGTKSESLPNIRQGQTVTAMDTL